MKIKQQTDSVLVLNNEAGFILWMWLIFFFPLAFVLFKAFSVPNFLQPKHFWLIMGLFIIDVLLITFGRIRNITFDKVQNKIIDSQKGVIFGGSKKEYQLSDAVGVALNEKLEVQPVRRGNFLRARDVTIQNLSLAMKTGEIIFLDNNRLRYPNTPEMAKFDYLGAIAEKLSAFTGVPLNHTYPGANSLPDLQSG